MLRRKGKMLQLHVSDQTNLRSIKILFALPKLNSGIAYSASNLGSQIDAAWGFTGATRKNSRSCKRRMIFLFKITFEMH